ncbi:MAG: NAD(P)/FAD-dependent oxidoreductase [Candidatus Aminicenantales bacterium]
MKIIIVGNGLAGVMAAKALREFDQKLTIDIFAEENYHYYPRPNLIQFLAGSISQERVFAFSEDWYRSQNIQVHLGKPVIKIFPEAKEVEVKGEGKREYDYLLLTTGSSPFIPPFKGRDKKGVFTIRNFDNTLEIVEYLKNHNKTTVVGGGLLGLEIARALKSRGAEVRVVEFFERLLPRQLDEQGASLLKDQIEKMGIKVHLGLATDEVLGQEEVTGLKFKGGSVIKTEMAVVAAGIRSNISLAQEAGLQAERGIVVNDYLQTNHPAIYAAGDNCQHRGRVYGIIPASFEQARIAAANILGQRKKYKGTIPANSLKVAGIQLTSLGEVTPEEKGFEEIRVEDREKGIYKKIVLRQDILVGAIWMGTKKGADELARLIANRVNVKEWKESLLNDDFDFSLL